MNPISQFDRDQLQQLLGAREERIVQLEREVAVQREQWQADAMEWQRLERHRRDLAEWLIDAATNEHGQLVKPLIDAGLGGESFVPCSFGVTENGKRYRLALASTDYEVTEIAEG